MFCLFPMLTPGEKAMSRNKRKTTIITALTPEQRTGKPFKVVYEKDFEMWLDLGGAKRQYVTSAEVEAMRDKYEVVIITTADVKELTRPIRG